MVLAFVCLWVGRSWADDQICHVIFIWHMAGEATIGITQLQAMEDGLCPYGQKEKVPENCGKAFPRDITGNTLFFHYNINLTMHLKSVIENVYYFKIKITSTDI